MKTKVTEGWVSGRLTVVRRTGQTTKHGPIFECRCSCGKTAFIVSNSLASHSTRSCGCLLAEALAAGRSTVTLGFGESSFRHLYANFKSRAKKHAKFNFTADAFKEMSQKNCQYCGVPPVSVDARKGGFGYFAYNGIDRVDNSAGYTVENCVPCCVYCNAGKRDGTTQEFLDRVGRICARHPR